MPYERRIGPAFKGGSEAILIYDILSPDCRDGKHTACIGDAWNNQTDEACTCECACHDVKEEM